MPETDDTKLRDEDIVIAIKDLTKSFDGRVVLNDINLDIRRGETIVIMGGSGCGKSTLLWHLIGAHRPDKGDISILGHRISHIDEDELNNVRKQFGILFQHGALYTSMTVGENVALPMREHTDLDDHIIDIMVNMKLEMVGLRGFEELMPSQISGGMQKRVALARAIALDPQILFYDEPTAGLDPILAGVIDQLIADLSNKLKVTSVVVTHDMRGAFKVADRIIFLYGQKVHATGTAEEIQNSDDPVVQQFISGAADGPIPYRQSSQGYEEAMRLGT